jgi:hypothetical protein
VRVLVRGGSIIRLELSARRVGTCGDGTEVGSVAVANVAVRLTCEQGTVNHKCENRNTEAGSTLARLTHHLISLIGVGGIAGVEVRSHVQEVGVRSLVAVAATLVAAAWVAIVALGGAAISSARGSYCGRGAHCGNCRSGGSRGHWSCDCRRRRCSRVSSIVAALHEIASWAVSALHSAVDASVASTWAVAAHAALVAVVVLVRWARVELAAAASARHVPSSLIPSWGAVARSLADVAVAVAIVVSIAATLVHPACIVVATLHAATSRAVVVAVQVGRIA